MTVCVVTLGVLLIYLYFWDGIIINAPIVFQTDETNIRLEKDTYRPGEVVKGYFEFCKKRNVIANIQWELIDSYLTFFPPKNAATTIGCHQVWAEIATIPKNSLPDQHVHFEGLLRYHVNAIHEVEIPLKTMTISITK